MPKERLHILLAQESMRLIESLNGCGATRLDETEKYSFLLGSVFPDVLFYDLPTFGLSSTGNSLHRLEGEHIVDLAGSWLQDCDSTKDSELMAWILGVSSHFLSDGLLHPAIMELSTRPTLPCATFRLSPRECHHWLESALEAYWLSRIGQPDGYFGLLDRFHAEAGAGSKHAAYFRELMERAGIQGVPETRRIERCLFWQTLLLKEFARARWSAWQRLLLGSRGTRFLGSLIIPERSDPWYISAPSDAEVEGTGNMFHYDVMARGVIYLTTRLRSLLGRC